MADDADNSKLLDQVTDGLEDTVTLSRNFKKIVAKKAVNAYVHVQNFLVTGAVSLPLTVVVPTISQEPIRRQDEGLPSQSRSQPATLESRYLLEVATTSAPISTDIGVYKIVKRKPTS